MIDEDEAIKLFFRKSFIYILMKLLLNFLIFINRILIKLSSRRIIKWIYMNVILVNLVTYTMMLIGLWLNW